MGGLGSGRNAAILTTTLDDLPKFNVDHFAQVHGLGVMLWQDYELSFGGSISVSVLTDAIRFSFFAPTWRYPFNSVFSAHRLEMVPCTKGGVRGHLQCGNLSRSKRCERMCRVLYFLDGQPMCRHCCGLHYRSQQNDPLGPAFARLHRLRRRLGASPGAGALVPPKPKFMHQTTYLRLSAQILEAFRFVEAQERSRQRSLMKWAKAIASKASPKSAVGHED